MVVFTSSPHSSHEGTYPVHLLYLFLNYVINMLSLIHFDLEDRPMEELKINCLGYCHSEVHVSTSFL